MNCATCCLDDVMLDVNVQLSRLDPAHVHDDADRECFDAHKHKAWATCPLTENGVLRIVGHVRAGHRQPPPGLGLRA